MSVDKFNDDCPGCRPALLNPTTKEVYPDDHPAMKAVLRVWDHDSTRAEREAYHEVCCGNSRDPTVLATADALVKKITTALAGVG